MEEIRFSLKPDIDEIELEKQFTALDLQQTMKGRLKSLPDNLHWHLKCKGESGVCEVTLLLLTREVIISCKKNREAIWISETAQKLRNRLSL